MAGEAAPLVAGGRRKDALFAAAGAVFDEDLLGASCPAGENALRHAGHVTSTAAGFARLN